MFGGLSFFLLFLFFFVIKREKIYEQKFAAIELSLEDLNKELFLLKKEIKNNKTLQTVEKIEEIVETIVDDIKMIEEKNKEFYEKVENDIVSLQQQIKKNALQNTMSNLNRHEEEKIIALYKNGYSIEDISRELRIPAGEIELILKFSNI
jgi:Na+/phosphate symporter